MAESSQEEAIANDISTSRLRLGEIGSEAISVIQEITQRLTPVELKYPQCLKTYELMKQDATVVSALNAGYIQIEKRFTGAKIRFKDDSERSKEAAEFVDWCLKNMDNQTLRSVARNAATFRENGFSILEKCYTKINAGKYKGKYKIKKLGLRPAMSLYHSEPFVVDGDGRNITYIQQDPNYFKNTVSGSLASMQSNPLKIERKKVMLMGYNVTDDRPMGSSPLRGAFSAWREKSLIQSLEVVGTSKDLAGTPVFRLPLNIMEKAASDPTSPEAISIKSYMQQLANLHCGEQTYMMLPSDLQEKSSTAQQYDISFLGVQGTGKSFDTMALVTERKKAILDVFGAGHLNVGNDSEGANNLAESKNSLHNSYIEHDCNIICESFNYDLIPQLLAMNEIFLPEDELPYIEAGLPEEVDLEGVSKAIQRVGAIGFIPKTPEILNEMFEMLGFHYRIPEELLGKENEKAFLEWSEKYLPDSTSRSGDGMAVGTSGNGTAKSSSTRDNSVANKENS